MDRSIKPAASWSSILFLFLSALFWSFSGIFTKSVSWNGWSLACVRGALMFVILLFVRGKRPMRPSGVTLLMALCYFMQGILFLSANKYTTAGNATVFANASPLYIILFTALYTGKRPGAADLIVCMALLFGILLSFAGSLSPGSFRGDIYAIVSGLFYAGVYFLSSFDKSDTLDALTLGNAMYLPLMIPLFMQDSVRNTTLHDWLFILTFSLITGAAAWLCFARGIRDTSPLHANFITMLEPILAPVWTFLLLGERLSSFSLCGFGVVITALALHRWWVHSHPSPSQARPSQGNG